MKLMKRNLLKAARFEECAVEIAKAIQNILKALDIAERAMLTVKKQTKIIGEKKFMAKSEKEGHLCKTPLMSSWVGNSKVIGE